MQQYTRINPPDFASQALSLTYLGRRYHPVYQHSTFDEVWPKMPEKAFSEHGHDVYHIFVYTEGDGHFSKGGHAYRATAGLLAMMSPGEMHDMNSRQRNATYTELTFTFESSEHDVLAVSFEQMLSLYAGVKLRFRENPGRLGSEEVDELVLRVARLTDFAQSSKGLAGLHFKKAMGEVFDFVIANCCVADEMQSRAVDKTAQEAKDYIDAHYAESISVDQLAGVIHMSKGHLFRVFKEAFRVSPVAYQQQVRVEAAKALLRSTSLRCNEVARRVGYENIGLFHRLFKKSVGVTPNQYRKGKA